MLKELRISNLILVENIRIPFEEGLNMITGETGSGKSAILAALSLAMGDRADTGMIRRGCDRGTVEAIFDIQNLPQLLSILEAAGIEHAPEDPLIIKREIAQNGKGRVHINNQAAQVTLLRLIGSHLLEIAGQHAHTRLCNLDEHRRMVDLFGDLQEEVKRFSVSWEHENRLRRELEEQILGEAQRLRQMEVCQMEIEELVEAAVKEGEDEELFGEYALLSNAQERASLSHDALKGLSLTGLVQSKNCLEHLVKIDPNLQETLQLLQGSLLELEEVSYTLRNYAARIDQDPNRADKLNDRISLITKLKRKYGETVSAMQDYLEEQKQKLQKLENADAHIEDLKVEIEALCSENHRKAQDLTDKRKATIALLQQKLTLELRSLNMPKAIVEIDIHPQARTKFGDDRIELFLTPNPGEHRIPVRECASGGELSRILLALHTLLAGKEATPTIIFDEIDANIGGETAVIVGQKLKDIGQVHQLICITHFAQVAQQADHHLKIYKEERAGRTLTEVSVLEPEMRQPEIARMQGCRL